MSIRCVLENGRLLIRESSTDSYKPEEIVWYWPTRFGRRDLQCGPNFELIDAGEVQVWKSGYTYSVKFPGCSAWCETGIHAKTKAVRVEVIPLECPRVRKGLDVRYRNGRWEKYLKTKGWVAA